jgi:hypothetical protein
MPGDDLYKNLKDPAPDSLPKFEEESWKKMELLLDKYLPENNSGRVFPYILFLGCIILASLTTFLPAKRTAQLVSHINIANSLAAKPNLTIEKNELQLPEEVGEANTVSKTIYEEVRKIQPGENSEQPVSNEIPTSIVAFEKQKRPAVIQLANDKPKQEFITNEMPLGDKEVSLRPVGGAALSKNNHPFLLRINVPVNNSLLMTTNEKKPTVKKPKKNGLSLTFSTGLETPGTAFNTWGRLTPVVGIGLMYNIGEKIIVRAGVNSATKIYSAHDKDYNPPNNYWASYTYFKRIDADCKIIEIPLGVAYRVVGSKKTNLYVSAGASSIIMRKEAYEYYYKNQAGRDTITQRAYNNNSFHLFSNINFSAIAERKITNRFSLMAEPGIKIPSAGIGVGKIRLYNAGLTVTAKFKLR